MLLEFSQALSHRHGALIRNKSTLSRAAARRRLQLAHRSGRMGKTLAPKRRLLQSEVAHRPVNLVESSWRMTIFFLPSNESVQVALTAFSAAVQAAMHDVDRVVLGGPPDSALVFELLAAVEAARLRCEQVDRRPRLGWMFPRATPVQAGAHDGGQGSATATPGSGCSRFATCAR